MVLVDLPHEVLLHICSYLDTDSLLELQKSHTKLRSVVQDDSGWNRAFLRTYGITHQRPSLFPTWRETFLNKITQLRAIASGHGRSQAYNPGVGQITHTHRIGGSGSLMTLNIDSGIVSLSDIQRGRVYNSPILGDPRILDISSISCVVFHSNDMLLGHQDGKISLYRMSRTKLVHLYSTQNLGHPGQISAMSCADRSSQNHALLIVSGDALGNICLWELDQNGIRHIRTTAISQHRILVIEFAQDDDLFYAVDAAYHIFHLTESCDLIHEVCPETLTGFSDANDPILDIEGRLLFLRSSDELIAFKLADGTLFFRVAPQFPGQITAVHLGSVQQRDTKQHGAYTGVREIAIADNAGNIVVYSAYADQLCLAAVIDKAHGDCITTMTMDHNVIVSGSISGSIHVHELLTGEFLRSICSSSEEAPPFAGPPGVTSVSRLCLNSRESVGFAVAGNSIRYFSWSEHNRNSRQRGSSARSFKNANVSLQKAQLRREIDVERATLCQEQIEDQANNDYMSDAVTGPLAYVLNSDELEAYVRMLSMEDHQRKSSSLTDISGHDSARRKPNSMSVSTQEDEDIMTALAMSLSML